MARTVPRVYHGRNSPELPLRQVWDHPAMERLLDPDGRSRAGRFSEGSRETVRLALNTLTLRVFGMAEDWGRSGCNRYALYDALLLMACLSGVTKHHCWTMDAFFELLDTEPVTLDLPRIRQLYARSGCFSFANGDGGGGSGGGSSRSDGGCEGYALLGRVVRFCDVFVPLMLPTYETRLSDLSMHALGTLRRRHDRATTRMRGLLKELDSREEVGEDVVSELVTGVLTAVGDRCDPYYDVRRRTDAMEASVTTIGSVPRTLRMAFPILHCRVSSLGGVP